MQIDILTKLILPLSLFLIMLGMGLSLKIIDFKQVLKYPKAMTIGLAGQMFLLPIVAFIIIHLFKVPTELAVGLMIIALTPGGATSNMFSYLFKGDVALSISLTAIVGLIALFTIPIIVALSMDYFMGDSQVIELPVVKTIIQLLIITVVPVAIGMLVLSRWPVAAQKIEATLKWLSVAFMFLIIGLIIWINADNMMQFFADVGLATFVLNIVVLTLGYFIAKRAKLSKDQAITIGFEIGLQNASLALVVAGTLLGNTTMMIPAVTYGLLMFITGAIFGRIVTHHKTKAL